VIVLDSVSLKVCAVENSSKILGEDIMADATNCHRQTGVMLMYKPAYLVCKKCSGRLTKVVPSPAYLESTAFESLSKWSSDVQIT
jgi:hypothetical protein